MPNSANRRPRPATETSGLPLSWAVKSWAKAPSRRARAADPRLKDGPRVLEELAEVVEGAEAPADVQRALVRLAHRVSGADRVELFLAHDLGDGTVLRWAAGWPAPVVDGGSIPGVASWQPVPQLNPAHERPTEPPLRLPLRCGGRVVGTLLLTPAPQGRSAAGALRILNGLCTLAAAAERALRTVRPAPPADPESDEEESPRVQDGAFLSGLLPYALAHSRRHNEPLSLLYIAIDRLAAIRRLHGPALAETVARQVGEAIANTLRASDVVARLDHDRLAVILSGAGADDARSVADVVRTAVADAGRAMPDMPALSATICVATYPDDAQDGPTLLAAAASALARLRG